MRGKKPGLDPPVNVLSTEQAADLGRLGGRARASVLSPERRTAIARKAAITRWGFNRDPDKHIEAIKELARTKRLPVETQPAPGDFSALAREINERFAEAITAIEEVQGRTSNWRQREELDETIAEFKKTQAEIKRRLLDFGRNLCGPTR